MRCSLVRLLWSADMRWVRLAGVVAALALTAGCASMTRTELAQDGLAGIRVVDVVMPPEPSDYQVSMVSHPGAAVGGAIGAIIIGADQSAKTDRVKQALAGQPIAITRTMAGVLVQRLKAAGYRVRQIEAPWVPQSVPPSVNVEAVESDADALLVVAPRTIGFVASSALEPYQATVMAEVTLLGRDHKAVLYHGLHSAGLNAAFGDWRNVPARRSFQDVDGLVANPAATASALTDAGTDVARAIADDIRLSAASSPPLASRRS
jgi:hypothetical protein